MKFSAFDSLSPRTRRILKWCVGLLLTYTILGFLVLPPIIRAVAAKQLSKQLDREVTIQKVKLNPFALSATIRGLLIRDKDGEPFVSWDEVYVNVQASSLFGTYVFKEVSTTKPYVRVQMNKDYTFNFSDLIAKFSTNAPSATPSKPAKPLALRIDRLQIRGASASLTDLTPRTPFKRVLGPIDVTLEKFKTDPENKNPYSFSGTTDAGEEFSWSGFFYLDPIRSQGEFSLKNLTLNKYAALYQDFVRFQIRDGVVSVGSAYQFELSASNRVAVATNASFHLHNFRLAEPDADSDLAALPDFSVSGASLDAVGHRAEVQSVSAADGRLQLRRGKDQAINVVELSKPVEGMTNAPGGILVLLQSVTNVVSMLLNSTNQWAATVHDVSVTNCALALEDLANSRPVHLELDQISLNAKHISNLPGTNLAAALSLRWNTNGTIKIDVEASFLPPTAMIQIALDRLELRPLDPYLEPKLNVFVLDSKLSMNGRVHLRTTNDALPEVTFAGDVRLDDFSTVDGEFAEDLLKWNSVRLSGMDANLNPPTVSIREIAVDDAFARVVIETNRTINLMTALRMQQTNAPANEEEKPAEPKPLEKTKAKDAVASAEAALASATNALAGLPKISIATVVISNAQVRFTDRSLATPVNMTVQQANGTISGLSTEELQHADVHFNALVDNVGPVEVIGAINPFRPDSTNDIRIAVKNVDLTPTSPYVGKFAGYRLAKGKLELDLAYHLHDRELKSENVIVLDQFTFGEKVNSPDATKLPVRLAIAILKDRNGKILLDVPIEGSLDDPQFRLRKVILHTLGNILTKVATSPFSMLGAVFGGGGEELSFQDFAPGSAELLAGNRQKLDSLVKGLYERPALQLDIEGSIDPATDLDGLRRATIERRMKTMKWMSLRKSEQATHTADQITFVPEERDGWLKKIYAEAMAKGQIAAALTNTSATAGLTNQAPAISLATARALAGLDGSSQKGATALMRLAAEKDKRSAGSAKNPSAGPAKLSASETMERLLMNSISISDSEYQALAAARAKAVRDYILQSGKVEPERVFLVEKEAGGVKMEGARAYLQLK